MKDFGEKFFRRVLISTVWKFEERRWYGSVREMVVQVKVRPMIMCGAFPVILDMQSAHSLCKVSHAIDR